MKSSRNRGAKHLGLTDLTADAVLKAMAEYDRLGRAAFLSKYGFKKARSYYVLHDGRRYDSKALAGAAHQYVSDSKEPLTAAEFSGGANTVKPTLEKLGFQLDIDPDLTLDEHILALDLYFKAPTADQNHPKVQELSSLLNRYWRALRGGGGPALRNPDGVSMKLSNFQRLDPQSRSGDASGLFTAQKAKC